MNVKTKDELMSMTYPGNIQPERFFIAGRVLYDFLRASINKIKNNLQLNNLELGVCRVTRNHRR